LSFSFRVSLARTEEAPLSPIPTIAGSTLVLAGRPRARPLRELGANAWADELAELREAGFDAIDLVDSWLAPGYLAPAELRELAAVLADTGLRLAGISVVRRSVIDPRDASANLDYTLRSLDAAAALSAPVVSIGFHRPLTAEQRAASFWLVDPPRDDRSEKTWRLAAERVAQVVARAEQLGIAVALELHEGTLLDSAAGALRVIEQVGSSSLGVNPDLGNLVRVPEPLAASWEETFRAVLPRTTYWHVKNYTRVERPGLVLTVPSELEAGHIDYRRALRLALDAGYAGPVCIEHYEGDALGAIARGRAYVEHVVREREHAVVA
jgi:sugar phosphate isomerase/epimerase